MMNKIFITGGAGFVGSHLTEKLLNRGNEVTVLDIEPKIPKLLAHLENKENFEYIQGNVQEKSKLESLITKDYDKIFHLAAIVGVENYCHSPLKTIDVNFGGTRNIVDIALKNKIKIIFSSTSEVFGKNPEVPWKEDSNRVLGATSVDRWSYSTSKSLCEHLIFAVHKKYDLPVVIVRYFNVYGPRQKTIFVIPAIIEKVLSNEQPIIYDSGRQTRCFTYIEDAVEGTIIASEKKEAVGESFNIGSTIETSISDVAKKILKLANKNKMGLKYIDTEDLYYSYEDLDRRVPDATKAKRILNWEATTSLEQGLSKTYHWYKNNMN